MKLISTILLESWSEYQIENIHFGKENPEFNPFACINPFILMEANPEEALEFDEKTKNIFSKRVSFVISSDKNYFIS